MPTRRSSQVAEGASKTLKEWSRDETTHGRGRAGQRHCSNAMAIYGQPNKYQTNPLPWGSTDRTNTLTTT